MDISKGDQAQFNANGVPTTVDISFTITDLYEVMSITPTDATTFKYDTLNNTAQMDYIANFCGVNVYKPEIGRTLSMWFVNNFTNRAKDFVSINFPTENRQWHYLEHFFSLLLIIIDNEE